MGPRIGYLPLMKMASYPNRLADCMALAQVNDPQLAKLANTTKQQIFKLRQGERKLTVEWARRLAPHLNVEWQALIEGPQGDPDPDLAEVVAAWREADDVGKAVIKYVAKSVSHVPPAPDPAPGSFNRRKVAA